MHHVDSGKTYGEKNLKRMLRAILNKSWRQHPTKEQLFGQLLPVTKAIKIRRTRHAGHCWRSKDELVRDVLLWTSSQGREKAGRPARTYIQQLSADTGCSPEDLPKAMDHWEGWRERVRNILADSAPWWWCFNENLARMFSFRLVTITKNTKFAFRSTRMPLGKRWIYLILPAMCK